MKRSKIRRKEKEIKNGRREDKRKRRRRECKRNKNKPLEKRKKTKHMNWKLCDVGHKELESGKLLMADRRRRSITRNPL